MGVRTFSLGVMTQRSQTASNPKSALLDSGDKGGMWETPSGNVEDFSKINHETHRKNAATVEPIDVPVDVMDEKQRRLTAMIMQLMNTAHTTTRNLVIVTDFDKKPCKRGGREKNEEGRRKQKIRKKN